MYLIGSEVLFDWLKGIVVFKVSGLNPGLYKNYYLEIAIYHEKLKFNCFNSNGGPLVPKNSLYLEYTKKIEQYELDIANSSNNSRYSSFLDFDNLSAIEVGYTNVTICVLFLSIMMRNVGFQIFSRNFFLIVIISIVIQRINRFIISNMVVEKIDRCLAKKKEKEKEKKY
jgi:hypothetical protein